MLERPVTQWKNADTTYRRAERPGHGYESSESPSLLFVAPALTLRVPGLNLRDHGVEDSPVRGSVPGLVRTTTAR
jgi:hypothetical protein